MPSLVAWQRTFELDGVFDEKSSTSDVYAMVGEDLVRSVLSGVNATMMCYGMTGSGKTHTMLGDRQGREEEGIVGLAARQLLAAAAASYRCSLVAKNLLDLVDAVASVLQAASAAGF